METSRVLSKKEDSFIEHFGEEAHSPEKAVKEAGYAVENEDQAKRKASTLLKKRKIREALEERWQARTLYGKTKLQTGVKASIGLLQKIMNNEDMDPDLRVKAIQEILDRAGLVNKKWKSKSVNVSVRQNFSNDDKKELQDTVIAMKEKEKDIYEPEKS